MLECVICDLADSTAWVMHQLGMEKEKTVLESLVEVLAVAQVCRDAINMSRNAISMMACKMTFSEEEITSVQQKADALLKVASGKTKDKEQAKKEVPKMVDLGEGQVVDAELFLHHLFSLNQVQGWISGRNLVGRQENDPDLMCIAAKAEAQPHLYLISSHVLNGFKPGFSIADDNSLNSRYGTSYGVLDCFQTFKLSGKQSLESNKPPTNILI